MISWRTTEVEVSGLGIAHDIDWSISKSVLRICERRPEYYVEVDHCSISNIDGRTLVTVFAKIEKRGESQQHSQPCQCPLCHDPATCEICKKAAADDNPHP